MVNGVPIDKAQASISSLSLLTVLSMAFRVQPYRVFGPDWLKTTACNITAKLPEGASTDQVPEMLQSLFAERFGLKFHRENREQPVYVLTVAKSGLKARMKDPAEDQEPAASESGMVLTPMGEMRVTHDPKSLSPLLTGTGMRLSMYEGHLHFEFSQTAKLAQALSTDVGRPVLDETNLTNGKLRLSIRHFDAVGAKAAADWHCIGSGQ